MKKQQVDKQRFEFQLLINNNIICQRYFDIIGYNEACRESFEIKELISEIVGMNNDSVGSMGIIPRFLKNKSLDYTWGYYNPYKEQTKEDVLITNVNKKDDRFQFEIKEYGETIVSGGFSGNSFPTKVRYDVNIRELIPEIISEIRYYMTKNVYTKEYGTTKLKRHNKIEKKK